jgi:ketol-acid reductoisomerase
LFRASPPQGDGEDPPDRYDSDQVQPRVFNKEFAPKLKDTVCIVVASGYNVFYKLLEFKPTQDVVMVAPR